MNIKKVYLGFTTLLCLHCTYSFTSAHVSSKSVSQHAEVETLFLPQAREQIFERLSSFFGSAQNKILIAMYWLTSDTPVIELLRRARERNVDVKVILDKSTLTKFPDIITKLSMHNIIPLISLRPASIEGKMHNKFIVIDDTAVWTGSANFTPTVIKPDLQAYNDENIIIIKSPDLAKQFSDQFERLEQSIIGFYIYHIDSTSIRSLPNWFPSLCAQLYEHNSIFRNKISEHLRNPETQQLHEKIFAVIPAAKMSPAVTQAPEEEAAAPQPESPEYPEFTDEYTEALEESEFTQEYSSRQTMSELQRDEESQFQDEPAAPTAQRRRLAPEEEATPEQKAFLEGFGLDLNIPREEADKIIKRLLAISRSPEELNLQRTAPATQMRKFAAEEEATPEQKKHLETLGYNPNVSKDEAEKIIKRVLEELFS